MAGSVGASGAVVSIVIASGADAVPTFLPHPSRAP
jgi:hypothetical protein